MRSVRSWLKNIGISSLLVALAATTTIACVSKRALRKSGCYASSAELRTFPHLSIVPKNDFELGRPYRLSGFLYYGFEESGFVPEPFLGRANLENQSLTAFCVLVEPECSAALESFEPTGDRGPVVVEMEAIGRLESFSGSYGDFSWNRCRLGTIKLEKIGHFRFH